jgi:riboflavin-specific deaminase-like protein
VASVGTQADPGLQPPDDQTPVFRRLLPPGDPATVEQIIEDLGVRERSADARGRPYVMLNMVSTADGRVSIAGRSGSLGNRADSVLFHALRGVVDAVMVGAGTVKAERYGPIVPQESRRLERRERGLADEPLACVVSGRLSLPADIPLLTDPASRVVVVTDSEASLQPSGARIEYVRAERDGMIDLARALVELHDRFDIRTLLCEGGPHLNSQLLSAGLVDELFLSLSPKLAGDQADGLPPLRVVAGADFDPPIELELLGVRESGSQLLLSYGVRASAAERVS